MAESVLSMNGPHIRLNNKDTSPKHGFLFDLLSLLLYAILVLYSVSSYWHNWLPASSSELKVGGMKKSHKTTFKITKAYQIIVIVITPSVLLQSRCYSKSNSFFNSVLTSSLPSVNTRPDILKLNNKEYFFIMFLTLLGFLFFNLSQCWWSCTHYPHTLFSGWLVCADIIDLTVKLLIRQTDVHLESGLRAHDHKRLKL